MSFKEYVQCTIGSIVYGIVALVIFVIISFIPPILGGVFGNFLYRIIMGKNLSEHRWTYICSMVPVAGPLISAWFLMDI